MNILAACRSSPSAGCALVCNDAGILNDNLADIRTIVLHCVIYRVGVGSREQCTYALFERVS